MLKNKIELDPYNNIYLLLKFYQNWIRSVNFLHNNVFYVKFSYFKNVTQFLELISNPMKMNF